MLHAPKPLVLRAALAALMATSLFPSPAHAAGTDAFWARLDQLVSRQAYPTAMLELERAMARGAFEERWSDRAEYWLGYVERRSGEPDKALAELARVPTESAWYLKALQERAEIERQKGDTDGAIALYEKLLTLVPDQQSDAVRAPLADLYFESGQYAKALTHYRALASTFGPQ
ncbi:MAG TPA: tetratricopeptide repeat protein, partial [Oscillatoriaceae cyanobacterium]